MVQEFLCPKHNLSFSTDALFKEHKRLFHPAALPPGVSPEMLPTPDFVKKVEEIERGKSEKILNNPVITDLHAEVLPILPPESPPIPSQVPQNLTSTTTTPELTYQWVGKCPTHAYNLQTFAIHLGRSLVMVAFCPQGHQVAQQNVSPLTKKIEGPKKEVQTDVVKKKKV